MLVQVDKNGEFIKVSCHFLFNLSLTIHALMQFEYLKVYVDHLIRIVAMGIINRQ